jgi:hypothetical protein
MPLDRFLHAAAGHSVKVNKLTDFEFRVWAQYLLSADDFGVMRLSAAQFQADNDALAMASPKKIEKALAVIIGIDLLEPFAHQGKMFVFQPDWQKYQKVEYPRTTTMPKLPPAQLAACDMPTQYLFSVHPGGKRAPRVPKELPENSPNTQEEVDALARAHGRESATANGEGLKAQGQRPTAAEVLPMRRRGLGVLISSPIHHANHGRCNDRGVCMPQTLYVEILGRFSGDVTRFDEFYNRVLSDMPDDYVPGGSVFTFWQTKLAQYYPDMTPTKVNAREAAMKADW